MDFSLRVNRKQIATNSSPYRDQQFQHISWLRARFQRQGLPIISVDSKKRELIDNFKNSGSLVGSFAGSGEITTSAPMPAGWVADRADQQALAQA